MPLWRPTSQGILQPRDWKRGQAAGGGGGGITSLDGLGATFCYSMGRKLLTAYGGGFYTVSSGSLLSGWLDQVGGTGTRDYSPIAGTGTGGNVTTAGTNSRACIRFNGTDEALVGPQAANQISPTSGYAVASVIFRTLNTNSGINYQNDTVWRDASAFVGLHHRTGGSGLLTYNWDGNEDVALFGSSASTGTKYVVEWRHEGGNIYIRVNGAGEVSAASSNTSGLGAATEIARGDGPVYTELDIFEFATFQTVPSLGNRDAIVTFFSTWVG